METDLTYRETTHSPSFPRQELFDPETMETVRINGILNEWLKTVQSPGYTKEQRWQAMQELNGMIFGLIESYPELATGIEIELDGEMIRNNSSFNDRYPLAQEFVDFFRRGSRRPDRRISFVLPLPYEENQSIFFGVTQNFNRGARPCAYIALSSAANQPLRQHMLDVNYIQGLRITTDERKFLPYLASRRTRPDYVTHYLLYRRMGSIVHNMPFDNGYGSTTYLAVLANLDDGQEPTYLQWEQRGDDHITFTGFLAHRWFNPTTQQTEIGLHYLRNVTVPLGQNDDETLYSAFEKTQNPNTFRRRMKRMFTGEKIMSFYGKNAIKTIMYS